jgi:hypothetical protein
MGRVAFSEGSIDRSDEAPSLFFGFREVFIVVEQDEDFVNFLRGVVSRLAIHRQCGVGKRFTLMLAFGAVMNTAQRSDILRII